MKTLWIAIGVSFLCTLARAQDADPGEAAREEMRRKTFKSTIDYLDEAVRDFDRHEDLEDWNWFSIGTNKDENLKAINDLLDKAIEVLSVSKITASRQTIRDAEERILKLEKEIDRCNLEKVSAKPEAEMGAAEKLIRKSREDYESAIQEARHEVESSRKRIDDTKALFVEQLRSIGVEIDPDSADTLLATVSGGDLVDMCVVFDNVKYITIQLERLTEESGESGETARRYYGMYVMLIRIMDRIQKGFIQAIDEKYLPKLEAFYQEANRNISEAKRNLRAGGSREICENNIRINELTLDAVREYDQHLRAQAAQIRERNKTTERDLRDALNTYNSVKLSTNVAAMLRAGSKSFAAVSRLKIPDLRVFENKELRKEFDRLTSEMVGVE